VFYVIPLVNKLLTLVTRSNLFVHQESLMKRMSTIEKTIANTKLTSLASLVCTEKTH